MSKMKINFKHKEYVLEFTRNTAGILESKGFVAEEITSKPNMMIPLLLNGAFVKNHSNIKISTVEEIYASIPNKSAFITKLVEMYTETVSSLVEDSEETEGNATWEMN